MLCPFSAFLSVHSFQILLMYLYFPYTHSEGGTFVPPPRIFLVCFVFCIFIRISVSFVVSNWVFQCLIFTFFYSLSMNIRFYLQFLTHSPICIVLSAQYYTLFICHSAYFSSNSLCFLSIISSILAIYCPTSLTFSHLSMRCVPSGFGTGQTRLVLAPATEK